MLSSEVGSGDRQDDLAARAPALGKGEGLPDLGQRQDRIDVRSER